MLRESGDEPQTHTDRLSYKQVRVYLSFQLIFMIVYKFCKKNDGLYLFILISEAGC